MQKSVIIIGGGVVGCVTALKLAKRGLKVTLVERGVVAKQSEGASSWAGAGILFPLLPWDYPDALNAQVLSGASQYAALCAELLAETGIDAQYTVSGMVALNAVTGEATADLAAKWCERNAVVFSQNNNQLLLPTIAQIRPPRLLQALRAYLIKLGVHLLENITLLPSDNSFTNVKSVNGETFSADYYVIAGGAWSGHLAADIAIKPMRGQMLRYANAGHLTDNIIYQDGVYIVPRQDGELLIGSTVEDVGFDVDTTETAFNALKCGAEAMIPALKNHVIIQHWSGLRPCLTTENNLSDNLPMVMQHPTFERVFINTGHFRYGLTMAPHSATILSQLIA